MLFRKVQKSVLFERQMQNGSRNCELRTVIPGETVIAERSRTTFIREEGFQVWSV